MISADETNCETVVPTLSDLAREYDAARNVGQVGAAEYIHAALADFLATLPVLPAPRIIADTAIFTPNSSPDQPDRVAYHTERGWKLQNLDGEFSQMLRSQSQDSGGYSCRRYREYWLLIDGSVREAVFTDAESVWADSWCNSPREWGRTLPETEAAELIAANLKRLRARRRNALTEKIDSARAKHQRVKELLHSLTQLTQDFPVECK